MASGFIDRVDGSGRDGVMGMPLAVVSALIDRARPSERTPGRENPR